MRKPNIYGIALAFRKAILKSKYNGDFNWRDRMSNFPGGCCDDSCDLFAHYLSSIYGIYTKQRSGVYCDNDPSGTTNHAWLVMDDNTIIDITADQFGFLPRDFDGVYVGEENSFYMNLDRIQTYGNCDIIQNKRLWDDYKIIVNYLVE